MGRILRNIYSSVVTLLFFVIALFLFAINIYNTSYTVSSRLETNFFVRDSVILNLLSLVAVIALIIYVRANGKIKKLTDKLLDESVFLRVSKILLMVIGAMSVVWVLATGFNPDFDQLYIQDAAYGLIWKNKESFALGGYIDTCPHQAGLVIISYILFLFFGAYNFVAFQLINALCVPLIYDQLSHISSYFGMSYKGRTVLLASGIFFIPLIVYSGFVYGTILGLFFALLSIRLMMKYLNGKRKIALPVLSVISMGISICFKSNYLIFAIAIGIYILIKCCEKQREKLLWILALVASLAFFSILPKAILRAETGESLDRGINSVSYMVMGLQESMSNAPGIYTGYNDDMYKKANYDPELQKKMVYEDYKSLLKEDLSDPMYMLDYFLRKQTHQWSDPSYKSFWNLESLYSDSNVAPWALYIMRPDVNYYFTMPLNLMQSVIYAGAVLYVMLCRKRPYFVESLVLPVTFVGGFIFHTIWEAKSQYTIPYFVLLFPIAVMGLMEAAGRVNKIIKDRKSAKSLKNIKVEFGMGTVMALSASLMFLVLVVEVVSGIWGGISKDTAAYRDYRKEGYLNQRTAVAEGTYNIVSQYDEKSLWEDGSRFEINYVNGKARIRLSGDQDLYVTVNEIGGVDQSNFTMNYFKPGEIQEFDIVFEDGAYYIVFKDRYTLTRGTDGSVFFIDKINHPQQKWSING